MLLQPGNGWPHLKAGKTRERCRLYVLVYTYYLTSVSISVYLALSGNLSVSLALSMNIFYSVRK